MYINIYIYIYIYIYLEVRESEITVPPKGGSAKGDPNPQ